MVKIGEYEATSFKNKDRIGSLIMTIVGAIITASPQIVELLLGYVDPAGPWAVLINIVGVIIAAIGVQSLAEVRVPDAETLAVFNYVKGNADKLPNTVPQEIMDMSPANVDEVSEEDIADPEMSA